MKLYHILLFVTIISLSLFDSTTVAAQVDSTQTVIWRGFDHSWTYNHRINRFGNYVTKENDQFISAHLSASGLGADSTFYQSHYSFVDAKGVNFYQGVEHIKLYGKEKQLLTQNIEVVVAAPLYMKDKEQYITLLNGFDLKAIDRADKIQLLRLSVEDAVYAPAINEIRFLLKVALVVNCQSMECSRFDQKTTYDLQVYYQIASGSNEAFESTQKTITKNYPWGRKDEYQHPAIKDNMAGKKNEGFSAAAVGIKSMALTLNAAHWTVQYSSTVTPLAYTASLGKLDFATDLFFKEWQPGMKKQSAKPKLSAFSSKKKGWCVIDMGVVMLQFKEAQVSHENHKGQMYWEGFNAPSDSPKAISKKELTFPFDTMEKEE